MTRRNAFSGIVVVMLWMVALAMVSAVEVVMVTCNTHHSCDTCTQYAVTSNVTGQDVFPCVWGESAVCGGCCACLSSVTSSNNITCVPIQCNSCADTHWLTYNDACTDNGGTSVSFIIVVVVVCLVVVVAVSVFAVLWIRRRRAAANHYRRVQASTLSGDMEEFADDQFY
eukprot:EC715250.1.p1 GENE.EC715250.1~~EC715250.1.p1  ORF type:complete len:170 (+),score=16.72 EC715250.1:58-567(+)